MIPPHGMIPPQVESHYVHTSKLVETWYNYFFCNPVASHVSQHAMGGVPELLAFGLQWPKPWINHGELRRALPMSWQHVGQSVCRGTPWCTSTHGIGAI